MTIHWCGTGLSSVPGLRRLIDIGSPVRFTVHDIAVSRIAEVQEPRAVVARELYDHRTGDAEDE